MDERWTPRAPVAPRRPPPASLPATGRRGRAVAAAVLGGALVLGACGGSGQDDAAATSSTTRPETPTTTTSTPTTTTPDAEAEVEAVYRAFWDAVVTSGNPPDPDAPVLLETMTGELLDEVRLQNAQAQALGQLLRLPDGSQYGVSSVAVEVDGEVASVIACVVDDVVIYDGPSGLILNDRVSSGWTEAAAVRTPDGWRISANRFQTKVEGPRACA